VQHVIIVSKVVFYCFVKLVLSTMSSHNVQLIIPPLSMTSVYLLQGKLLKKQTIDYYRSKYIAKYGFKY